MSNFIGLVYATLKANNIDYQNMSTQQAIEKFNELTKKNGSNKITSSRDDLEEAKQNSSVRFDSDIDKKNYTEFKERLNNIVQNLENGFKQAGVSYINQVKQSKSVSPNFDFLVKHPQLIKDFVEPFEERVDEGRIRNAFIQAYKRQEFMDEAKNVYDTIKQKQNQILENQTQYIRKSKERYKNAHNDEYIYYKNKKNNYDKFEQLAQKHNYVITISPYSNSAYAIPKGEKVDWGYKPEGSFRVSDHWNWEGGSRVENGKFFRKIECPTNTGENFGMAVAIFKNGKYYKI